MTNDQRPLESHLGSGYSNQIVSAAASQMQGRVCVGTHVTRAAMSEQDLKLWKIDGYIVKVDGVAIFVARARKVEVPVWNITGMPLASAAR